MFNRQQIKANARFVLKRSYMTGVAVVLIVIIIAMVISLVTSLGGGIVMAAIESASQAFMDTNADFMGGFSAVAVIIMTLVQFAGMILVVLPASVGAANYFIRSREQTNPVTAEYFTQGFRTDYQNKLKAMFTTSLIIWLWSLVGAIPMTIGTVLAEITREDTWLLLALLTPFTMIPAYIASYRYRMVPFILANNGKITGKRARELSDIMTGGNKWNLFVMDLSFIGWMLLGFITCYIGLLFVSPYYMAAIAEAYTCLKAEAIQQKGATDENELPSLRDENVMIQALMQNTMEPQDNIQE